LRVFRNWQVVLGAVTANYPHPAGVRWQFAAAGLRPHRRHQFAAAGTKLRPHRRQQQE